MCDVVALLQKQGCCAAGLRGQSTYICSHLKRLLADICAKSSRCRSRVAALQGCADKAHTSIDIKVHSLGVRWQAHEPLTIQYFNIYVNG
jgi:hypothetical protein